MASIREGCDNPHVEPIVVICLSTGARWSEAERSGPSSVRNGVITVSSANSGKIRAVTISADLQALLLKHWRQHGPFTSAITSFRRALAKTTIKLPKGQAAHVLRHTFASHFIQKGGSILTLQEILGHPCLAVTRRYAHLAPDYLRHAVTHGPSLLPPQS